MSSKLISLLAIICKIWLQNASCFDLSDSNNSCVSWILYGCWSQIIRHKEVCGILKAWECWRTDLRGLLTVATRTVWILLILELRGRATTVILLFYALAPFQTIFIHNNIVLWSGVWTWQANLNFRLNARRTATTISFTFKKHLDVERVFFHCVPHNDC